jgi:hypothetical protein
MPMISIETPKCFGCAKSSVILLTQTQLEGVKAWQAGALIQNALPDLSPELRETILSGWHAACFDKAFATED